MYPGQAALLYANLTSGGPTQNYTWTVEGPIIKDFDNSVFNTTKNLTASNNLEDPTPMSDSDFRKPDIQFYWQPNMTDIDRTVTVFVHTPDNKVCGDTENYVVAMGNDMNHQAEDFYFLKNQSYENEGNRDNASIVLREHQNWHNENSAIGQSYNGSYFFKFHKLFLNHFDAWRKLFGYENITAWNPNSPIPIGPDIDHPNRLAAGVNYYPKLNQSLPEYFKAQPGADGPVNRNLSMFDNGTDESPNMVPRPCEVLSAPENSSAYPKVQDALNDFEPDQELLGCAVTSQYHNRIHVNLGQYILDEEGDLRAYGDMNDASTAPRDPIFWRLHKFIDNISVNRSLINDAIPITMNLTASNDTKPPQVFSENPFRLPHNPFITQLPLITDEEKDLFGISGEAAISVEFDEPVSGVVASDLIVNGSEAKLINGTGEGPYVFIGFKSPGHGIVNVTLSPGSIQDKAGNQFEGHAWEYVIVEPYQDIDRDGLEDGLEVDLFFTNPMVPDSDGDSMPDGFEVSATTCLDPLQSDAHTMDIADEIISEKGVDSDNDGVNNVQEYNNKTDPCSPPNQLDGYTTNKNVSLASVSTPIPFALMIEGKDSKTGSIESHRYDSFTNKALSIVNSNKITREISDLDEEILKRTVNNSRLFEADSFYPPSANHTEFTEYAAIATLGGKLHAAYWTDTSEGVPDSVRNLPYIVAHIFATNFRDD
jgi:hypothetical protein